MLVCGPAYVRRRFFVASCRASYRMNLSYGVASRPLFSLKSLYLIAVVDAVVK